MSINKDITLSQISSDKKLKELSIDFPWVKRWKRVFRVKYKGESYLCPPITKFGDIYKFLVKFEEEMREHVVPTWNVDGKECWLLCEYCYRIMCFPGDCECYTDLMWAW